MNFVKLRYFIEAAKCESFSAAARRLYTTQPNLSKQISRMEDELGVKLFRRSNRSISLTPAGAILYAETMDLPDRIENAIIHAKIAGDDIDRRLRIGVLEGQSFARHLPGIIRRFSEQDPGLQIELDCVNFSQLRHGLETHQYDFIITIGFELTSFKAKIATRQLLEQYVGVAVSRRDYDRLAPCKSFADFKDEPFIVISLDESPRCYERLIRISTYLGFKLKIVRKVSRLESQLLCVDAGIGVGLVDKDALWENDYNICVIPIQDALPEPVVAVWLDSCTTDELDPFLELLAYEFGTIVQSKKD